ncbi:MAG: ribbon-helix-helix protein, CopG family [Dissulfurispiraceae bacterium]|jgi:Arc/MetJ-type ribon-helix-helix transcriptional regulator
MIRTQVQLTEKQVEKIKSIAARKRQSMAEVVRDAIDGMIEGKTRPDLGERRKRALELAGKYKGESDLSTRHDDYLSEDFAR